MVHQKILINVLFWSHRSLIACYYPVGSIKETGKFEMLSSSLDNEELHEKYGDLTKDDVIAEDIINYWRIEP